MTRQSFAEQLWGERFTSDEADETGQSPDVSSWIAPPTAYELEPEGAATFGERWLEQQAAGPVRPTADKSFPAEALRELPDVLQATPLVQLTASVPTERILDFVRGARSNLGTEPGWGERLLVDLVDLPKAAPTTTVHVYVVRTVPFEVNAEDKRIAFHRFALRMNPVREPRFDVLTLGRYRANRVIEELFGWNSASIATAAGLGTTLTVDEEATYKLVIHSVLPETVGRVVEPRDQRSLRGFAFDKSTLTAEHERTIEWLAWDVLHSWHSRTKVVRITIDGHTDPVGSATYNKSLGLRRANAVADRLKQLINEGAGQLPAGTIESIEYVVQSFGEERPISRRVQALNRRVEITLLRDTRPPPAPLELDITVTRLEGLLTGPALDPDAVTRMRCLLNKLRESDTDDRFFNETQVSIVNRDNAMPGPTEWSRVRSLVLHPDMFAPSLPDSQVLANLGRIDESIIYGVRKMNQIIAYASGPDWGLGLLALANAFKSLNAWVLERLDDPKSIYSCYPMLHP